MACKSEGKMPMDAAPKIPLEGSTINLIPLPETHPGGPPAETRFMVPSHQMVAAQAELAMSFTTNVEGRAPQTPVISMYQAADSIRAFKMLSMSSFSIRHFWPETFLITCTDQSTKDTLLEPNTLTFPTFSLRLKPWSRFAHALPKRNTITYEVGLDFLGIPAHAWEPRTADILVADFGCIDRVSPITNSRIDMSLYRVVLCTKDPGSIPRIRWLEIPEYTDEHGNLIVIVHDNPIECTPNSLTYKVLFCVKWIRQLKPLPCTTEYGTPATPYFDPTYHPMNDGPSEDYTPM